MSTITEQFTAGELNILMTENPLPLINFKKVSIDGKAYTPEIAYGIDNAIAIKADRDFTGKEIEFVKPS